MLRLRVVHFDQNSFNAIHRQISAMLTNKTGNKTKPFSVILNVRTPIQPNPFTHLQKYSSEHLRMH